MKFARYLQETQIPEWKKAYIDYRKLKKRIAVIRKSQHGLAESHLDSSTPPPSSPVRTSHALTEEDPIVSPSSPTHLDHPLPSPSTDLPKVSAHFGSLDLQETVPKPASISEEDSDTNHVPPATHGRQSSTKERRPSIIHRLTMRSQTTRTRTSNRGQTGSQTPIQLHAVLPLHRLLPQLSPQELAFFTTLDAELEKIESFYTDRETEMQARMVQLKEQIHELLNHKRLFHEAHPGSFPWSNLLSHLGARFRRSHLNPTSAMHSHEIVVAEAEKSTSQTPTLVHEDKGFGQPSGSHEHHSGWTSSFRSLHAHVSPVSQDTHSSRQGHEHVHPARAMDPDDYLDAKKKLKKALAEHYRGLECLHNYRVLNITGFRKALKKFEKVTKIIALEQYMTEKVDKSVFATDKSTRDMMREVEDMFAQVFAHGDKKRAMTRLRTGIRIKSHHFSSFRSGILLGLSLPPLTLGIYNSFRPAIRESIPGWDGLLFIYGILLIPVLFALLVGVNLMVWARCRINYVFIFELDVRTRLDYREYFEIPCILLVGLCYAFGLSFSGIHTAVKPAIWPLIWLLFAATIMINPLPFWHKSSRYWLIRKISKLFASGTRRVEFADFWLGDQFCSLVFPLSNSYLLICPYTNGFDENWRKCSSSTHFWPLAFALAVLPLMIRFVQSVKRYYDSKLITHLVNGGKYASGIISYFFYYLWRSQGSGRGAIFALWCICNTNYAIYASSWDLLMDWSLIRRHARYPLLRQELVYSNQIFLYYFAIVSNVLIRFIWVIYIPSPGPSSLLRTFIAAMLEMLRRWQWNFYRLENEHLGNVDQYRITREVPLPYSFDVTHEDDIDEDSDDRRLKSVRREKR